MDDSLDVTRLLQDAARGRRETMNEVVPLIYEELRRIAGSQLSRERADHTLSTTALVHEAYFKLVDIERVEWQDRAHFFAVAARQMRRVLIDHARMKRRAKRGGGDAVMVPLDEAAELPGLDAESLILLDQALEKLEALNERQARVVECRCFVGLSVEETAAALNTSPTTVKRDWAFARAWLNQQFGEGEGFWKA
jgi:RNA polymerase sigma factor (TIGR02999 family)